LKSQATAVPIYPLLLRAFRLCDGSRACRAAAVFLIFSFRVSLVVIAISLAFLVVVAFAIAFVTTIASSIFVIPV